jgi:hypothetical protein
MSCHVDGLKMGFILLAREISKDCKEHGDKFKKAFKMTIQQQTLSSASKTRIANESATVLILTMT